ncbi:hypothetical protein FGO68_gene14257 [Halteria grandinella]|uniref:Uncharacterized protein n=1 Tax=Halteria grandinella TaxID=5974 RepID=A0A8J8NZR7_HALGN|nr:hypothetical protein FGO68_gene14257 [Halteria grandinella]
MSTTCNIAEKGAGSQSPDGGQASEDFERTQTAAICNGNIETHSDQSSPKSIIQQQNLQFSKISSIMKVLPANLGQSSKAVTRQDSKQFQTTDISLFGQYTEKQGPRKENITLVRKSSIENDLTSDDTLFQIETMIQNQKQGSSYYPKYSQKQSLIEQASTLESEQDFILQANRTGNIQRLSRKNSKIFGNIRPTTTADIQSSYYTGTITNAPSPLKNAENGAKVSHSQTRLQVLQSRGGLALPPRPMTRFNKADNQGGEPQKKGIKISIQNDERIQKHLTFEPAENLNLLFYDFNNSQRRNEGRADQEGNGGMRRGDAFQTVSQDRLPTRDKQHSRQGSAFVGAIERGKPPTRGGPIPSNLVKFTKGPQAKMDETIPQMQHRRNPTQINQLFSKTTGDLKMSNGVPNVAVIQSLKHVSRKMILSVEEPNG